MTPRDEILKYLRKEGGIIFWPPVQGPRADALRELEREGIVTIEDASLEQETRYRARLTKRDE